MAPTYKVNKKKKKLSPHHRFRFSRSLPGRSGALLARGRSGGASAASPRLPPTHQFSRAHRSHVFYVQESGYKFKVTAGQNKRWRRFRTDRRQYRMFLVQTPNESGREDHLIQNIFYSRLLERLVQALVTDVRRRHGQRRRPRNALLTLSLNAEGLSFPVVTDIGQLYDNRVGQDLFARLSRVLTSHQNLVLNRHFYIHATVVDGQRPELFLMAGGLPAQPSKWMPTLWKKDSAMDFLRGSVMLSPAVPDKEDPLSGCCLLLAIELSLAYQTREESSEATKRWQQLKRMFLSPRRHFDFGVTILTDLVRMRVQEHDLDLGVFRFCALNNLLRLEVDKMSINLIVVDQGSNYRKVFQHPPVYDFARPCVEVLSVSFLNIKKKELASNVTCETFEQGDRQVHHAAAVLQYENLNNANATIRLACRLCGNYYSKRYLFSHKCDSQLSERPKCLQCKRFLLLPSDYKNPETLKMLCDSGGNLKNEKCSRCQAVFKNKYCKWAHVRTKCKYGGQPCPKCHAPVDGKRWAEHRCGERYCRTCKAYKLPHHQCQMASPSLQKHVDLLAFIDTETFPHGEEDTHHVNAVGLSYESKTQPGVFSEVCFYDDALKHEADGQVQHDVFSQQYWTDTADPSALLVRREPGKKVGRGLFRDRASTSSSSSRSRVERPDHLMLDEAQEGSEEEEEEEEMEGGHASEVWMRHKPTAEDFDYVTEGRSALDKFVDFLLDMFFYGYVFLAHAGSRFDHMLLIRKLVQREIAFVPLFDGHKALQIVIPSLKLRFIDSYRYVKLPLSKFSARFPTMQIEGKTLGQGSSCQLGVQNLKKGTFPYKMNHPDYYEYQGAFPDEEFFLDEFSSEDKEKEYKETRNHWPPSKSWNLKEQLHLYLLQDVRVLRGGALCLIKEFFVFQEDLQREEKRPDNFVYFHPFSSPFFTSSSFVHAIWQYFELPEDTFFLVHNQRNARKTSRGELEWLSFLKHKTGKPIITANSSAEGQHKVGNYWVDGFDAESGVVYEFNGCAVHYHAGECQTCPRSGFLHPSSTNPFGHMCQMVWKAWCTKKAFLMSMGYTVVVMWECAYEALKKESEELQHFLRHVYYVDGRPEERLRLRSALRGGRVESFRLMFHEESCPDRELYYVDKNSLYPAVAIFNDYPCGMPEVLVGDENTIRLAETGFCDAKGSFWGLVQATVLPPDSLFLPLLPYNVGGKLKFGLCRTCLETMSSDFCQHNQEQRQLTDVWTTAEIEFAVACGYTLVKVWEAFAYRQMKPVFRKFYSRLAKIKLESEGFPENVVSDLDKQTYCTTLNRAMPGMALDWQCVSRNQSRRQFAKDVSNIGLGKFSQNDLRTNVIYVSSWEEFAEIRFNDPKKVVKNISPITEYLAEVSYEPNDLLTGYHKNTHVIVYAFVTAYARIGMMKDMRQLMAMGGRIFYTDTDSIIFDYPKTQSKTLLDQQFSMGSKAYNAYKYETEVPIASFATLGAKNYSYRTQNGDTCVKSRGFTLTNAKAMSILNHDSMKKLLEKYLRGETEMLESESFRMTLNRKTQTVKSGTMTKQYRNDLFDKRFVLPERMGNNPTACTLPFGIKTLQFHDMPDVNDWK